MGESIFPESSLQIIIIYRGKSFVINPPVGLNLKYYKKMIEIENIGPFEPNIRLTGTLKLCDFY